jgi:hypothetical protein
MLTTLGSRTGGCAACEERKSDVRICAVGWDVRREEGQTGWRSEGEDVYRHEKALHGR